MQQLFCKACNREVRVIVTEATSMPGQATLHDEELVCLDFSEPCTTDCPLGATTPDAMVGRITRNALPVELMHTVKSVCPSCGIEADMALYGKGRAACTVCGSPARWSMDHAEPA